MADRTDELQDLNERLKREIQERKRIAQRLLVSQERLRLALHAGGMGTWDWDLATGLVEFDETQVELTGLGRRSGNVKAVEFFERVHRDDRESLERAIRDATSGDEPFDHEFRLYVPEKGYRWLAGRGVATKGTDGQPQRMVGINFDITDRMKSQERLRVRTRAVEFATNGIFIADARSQDFPIVYVNPAFEELTGYPAAAARGRDCTFLQGPQTDPAVVEEISRALAVRAECDVTILNYRRDGTPFWTDLHIAPVEDEDGTVTHFVGIQTEITDRIEYEHRLREAQRHADDANRAKSEFLANMSHEIRTPLTAILGCADALYRQLAAEQPRETVKMIKGQGQLLLGLLNDILDLSKIEAGKLEIHRESCSIVAVIAEVQSLMQPQALEKRIELGTHYDSLMPESVETDPLRLRQVLLNLTSNAIKFTKAGRVDLTVSCRTSEPEARLVISVRDTGIGIPPERLQPIFEAFTQEGDAITRRVGGTGLGLTICQRLVEMLGGEITADSVVGEGSTFTVEMPIGETADLVLHSASELAERPSQAESSETLDILIPWRVLVAEDTRAIQFMLKRMLEEAVDEVVVVGNGKQALEAVESARQSKSRFDLILMDMQMPLMDGYEATIRLRNLGYTRPIIALTAGAMAGDREKCLDVGCTDYLSKPLSRGQLLTMIVNHYNEASRSTEF